ncbi:hypothetical protein B296_00057578 [Ensete ventricosum]|uniref:Uncharacterized protein n=1 Tax=Ensete ventricosum TaxID=4639 RepID=A0A426XFT6_ENSVE|nr:hypothetical protein B296_00057578 [Ensete ventricosum]
MRSTPISQRALILLPQPWHPFFRRNRSPAKSSILAASPVASLANAPANATVSGPTNAPANTAPANAPGCRCFLPTHSRSKQSNHYSPTTRFCSPSLLCRCCSSARCSVPSVLLCFPLQHIDTIDNKKSPSSALPPQHIDTVAALPLLPVAIAAHYFSIPESYDVPHLFTASVTLHRRLLPLLLQHQQPDLCFINKTEHHFLCFLDTNEQPLAPFWTLCLQHQAAATLLAAPKSDPNANTTAASPRTKRYLSCPLPLPYSTCGCVVLKLL